MTHCTTKEACGVEKGHSAYPEVAELMAKMTLEITQLKLASSSGKLFAELCKAKTKGASFILVRYTTSSYLSATNAIKRVLDK
ncbi:LOW QUALITY PROTEIN: Hypothetical protein PHPALM_19842 [Phytophthora palmivora]|uniref:Uncharacterized protein n=1 Tax=Phytophthora palmivora TaxID=4796 RepID=A0A2P4XGD3_9STRA|nr:LOW QUALITY PROTEIN: Hypothetical protein PHPALM_19842 [Phytophthora palmivora]